MGFDFGAATNVGAGALASYLRNQQARGQYDQQQARLDAGQQRLDAEQQREVRNDAMTNLLRQAEIKHYNAESERALRPATREGHVQVQPDGSIVLIDPVTGATTPVQGAKGVPAQHNIDPYSPAGVAARTSEYQATTGAAQAASDARAEARARKERIAEGLAVLGTTAKDPATQQTFGSAFQSVRAQNPTMHEGEAAYFAWKSLQGVRPDLVPPKQRTPNALDRLFAGGAEGPPEPGRQPLTAEEKQTARTDPGFATWLKAQKGYSEAEWQQ